MIDSRLAQTGQASPARSDRTRRRRAMVARGASLALAALAAGLVVDGARWGVEQLRGRSIRRAVFDRAFADGLRPFEPRLSHPLADRRLRSRARCGEPNRELLHRHRDLAQLERAGDHHGLASVYALSCDPERAVRLLRELPPSIDGTSDLGALLLASGGDKGDALEHLDQVLRARPGHPQALWNRGLALAALDLPLAAARSFRALAALGEPGWSEEAAARAGALEAPVQASRRAPAAEPPSPLGNEPLTVAKAQEYQGLAAASGDRTREILGWQLLGRAQAAVRDFDAGRAAFDRALELCREGSPPAPVCADTKLWLAQFRSERYQLQPAQELALAGRRECRAQHRIVCELRANALLQRIEAVRNRRGLSRAYAEENSLHTESCATAQAAREVLAEQALGLGDEAETRRQLAAVQGCQPGAPRFNRIGLSVLADLVRDPGGNTEQEWRWFQQSLAVHQSRLPGLGLLDAGRIRLYEGRATIEREPPRAEQVLEQVIAQTEPLAPRDDGAETLRMQALSTLMMGASRRGDHARAFELLARALRVPPPARCAVGAWGRSTHRVYLARGPASAGPAAPAPTVGLYRGDVLPAPAGQQGHEEPGLPAAIEQAVAGCDRVDVLATRPILGRARLLPHDLAWGYLRSRAAGPPRADEPGEPVHRLVVEDVEPPSRLDLPHLGDYPTPAARAGELVRSLHGAGASPAEVLRQLPWADALELHVHGILEPSVSDAPVLVLSPDETGRSLLGARDIGDLRLDRRPTVILGACEVAQSAGYWSFQHSLPESFMRAGARWVLASPAPVDDRDAGRFFERTWRRTRDGAHVAVALRDERRSAAWRAADTTWIDDVVVFHD